MTLPPFLLERFFGDYEFAVRHLLCASDCETVSIGELLEIAGAPTSVLTDLRLGYTDSQGEPELRRALANGFESVPAERLVVTNAPEEAIFVAMTALLEPGDRVVVLTPCYQSLFEIARWRGCEVAPWPLVDGEGGWELDLGELARQLTGGARLVVVNFPHNPTGYQPAPDEFAEILALAERHGVRVFSDEMYRGLESDGARLASAPDLSPGALALGGTSKAHGLPGLRIGWLAVGEQALVPELLRVKDYTTICSSGPGQLLARLAVEHAETLFARNRAIIAANRDELEGLCGRHPGRFRWRPPGAGPLAFLRLVEGSATEFCDRAREEAGVLLAPSPIFGFGDRHIRWGLGRRGFAEGLAALERWLGA